jgi:NAD(P)H-dependent FMN reductase
MMPHLAILSSSIRTDRQSHRVALYFEHYITNSKLATVEILDLKTYDFPLFEERLKNQKNPIAEAVAFKNKIVAADGIIIVTPEYNGSFPASLKNAIDLLYEEWKHKPISIATVSAGPYGGTQCLIALQFVLWKIMAFTVPAPFLVANVSENYDAKGNAIHKETTDRYATAFVSELLSCIKANTP